MVKEESSKKDQKPKEQNLKKEPRPEPRSQPKMETKMEPKRHQEDFQKPNVGMPIDQTPKGSMSNFQKPPQTPGNGMGYILTPGYENNVRSNYDQMAPSMYPGGMFEHGTPSRGMNEFSTGNHFPQMIPKSPYLQSPSPHFRNFGGRMGIETPQTGMSGRGPWRKEQINLSEMVS